MFLEVINVKITHFKVLKGNKTVRNGKQPDSERSYHGKTLEDKEKLIISLFYPINLRKPLNCWTFYLECNKTRV